MFSRLRENLIYKLIALGFAVALHFYASDLFSPTQSRIVPVDLTPRNLPTTIAWDPKLTQQVFVTVTGPQDEINRIPDSSISATIDLSSAVTGKNLAHVHAGVGGGPRDRRGPARAHRR